MWMDEWMDGWKGFWFWFCMSMGLLTRRLNLPLFRGCAYIPITFYELSNGFLMASFGGPKL